MSYIRYLCSFVQPNGIGFNWQWENHRILFCVNSSNSRSLYTRAEIHSQPNIRSGNRRNKFKHFLRGRTEERSRSNSVNSCRSLFFSWYRHLFSLSAPKLPFECHFRRYLMSPSWSLAATHTRAHYDGFWPHECAVNWWLSLAVIIAICSTGVERKREREKCFTFARWEVIGLPRRRVGARFT